jgi:hypothetical protein
MKPFCVSVARNEMPEITIFARAKHEISWTSQIRHGFHVADTRDNHNDAEAITNLLCCCGQSLHTDGKNAAQG